MSNQPSPWGNYQFGTGGPSAGRFQPQVQQEPVDQCAYRALGFGIGSILLMICGLIGAVMGVFAVINGLQAAQMENSANKVMGIVGIVLGVIGVLGSVGLGILFGVLMLAMEMGAE